MGGEKLHDEQLNRRPTQEQHALKIHARTSSFLGMGGWATTWATIKGRPRANNNDAMRMMTPVNGGYDDGDASSMRRGWAYNTCTYALVSASPTPTNTNQPLMLHVHTTLTNTSSPSRKDHGHRHTCTHTQTHTHTDKQFKDSAAVPPCYCCCWVCVCVCCELRVSVRVCFVLLPAGKKGSRRRD